MFLSSPNKSQQTEAQQEGEPEPLYSYEDDNSFDTDNEDCHCPWWSEDDMFNSDYDDQQYIPISHNLQPQSSLSDDIQQQEGTIKVSYFDSNPINNSNKQLKSNKLLPTVKSWICEHCNAINNLYHSLEERQFKCISCDNHYRPGQILIESKEEDKPIIQLYPIWICNQCSYYNDIEWNKCTLCSFDKPQKHLQIFQIEDKPKPITIHKSNNYNYDSLWNIDQQLMQFKVNCNEKLDVCNNKNNIASNKKCENIAKNKCEWMNNRAFREFDELQNYKNEVIENEKSENNKPSNWNCDFKFIK